MMPHTVPKRPMNGVVPEVVARKVSACSSFVNSTVVARFMARATLSTPLKSVVRLSDSVALRRDTRNNSS